MEKFKIGDRVAYYSAGIDIGRGTGTIIEIDTVANDFLIESDKCKGKDRAKGGGWHHPKQCRLLKKKERRRVWISNIMWNGDGDNVIAWRTLGGSNDLCEWTEFVEVKKK